MNHVIRNNENKENNNIYHKTERSDDRLVYSNDEERSQKASLGLGEIETTRIESHEELVIDRYGGEQQRDHRQSDHLSERGERSPIQRLETSETR